MKILTSASRLAIAASLFCTTLSAGPLREADIGEQSAWFAHADFDAFRASPAAKQLRDAYPGEGPLLAVLQAQTGFIAREHITGITAYGTGEKGQGGVLIRHKFSNEKLAAWLAQSGKAAPIGAAPTVRFELSAPQFHGKNALADAAVGDAPEKKILADFSRPGVLVLATDAARLDAAIARLSATEPVDAVPLVFRGLKTDAPVFTAFANVAAVKLARKGHAFPWAQRVNLVTLAVKADAGSVALDLRAEMTDADLAQNTANMIHSFFVAQTPRFPALEKAQVSPDARLVNVNVALPVSQIIAGIPAKKNK